MTANIQQRQIGEFCEVVAGQSPEGQYYNNDGIGMPFYQGKRDFGRKFVEAPTVWTTQVTKVARSGDILMSVRAPVGPVNFATGDICIGRGLAAIRPGNKLVNEFLFYQLIYMQPKIAGIEGAVFASINKAHIARLPIAYVPPIEQKRIVRILDEAFEGIARTKANVEANLRSARALFDSYLHNVFAVHRKGWIESTIGERIRFIDYRGKTPMKTDHGLRLITAKNVKMGYLQEAPTEFVDPLSYGSWMTRGIPMRGDVLFTTEAPLANVAQLDTDERVVFAQRIIIMQPQSDEIDRTFLKYLLLSQPVQRRIRERATGATAQGIKASVLKTIEFSYPPELSEQKAIVARLDALQEATDRLTSLYERKRSELDALKQSILHRAFSGQLGKSVA